VQKKLNAQKCKKEKPKKDNTLYPLKEGFYCPICKKPMTASGAKSHTGKIHHYYHCQKYHKSFKKTDIETAYITLLKSLKPDKNLIPMLRQMAIDIYEKNSRDLKIENEKFKLEIIELQEKKYKTMDRIDSGFYSEEDGRARLNQYKHYNTRKEVLYCQ
jgi:hypothetical protein